VFHSASSVLATKRLVDVPVRIISGPFFTQTVGTAFGVDVYASSLNMLVSDLDPNDKHPEKLVLGGMRVESRIEQETSLECTLEVIGTLTYLDCHLGGIGPHFDPNLPLRIMIVGLYRDRAGRAVFLPDTLALLTVDRQGHASGYLAAGRSGEALDPTEVIVMFAGTTQLSSASSGFLWINPHEIFLPVLGR
jgi:hypothetical protein